MATRPVDTARTRPASTLPLIERGDLLAALDRASGRKVTIISAPAGRGESSVAPPGAAAPVGYRAGGARAAGRAAVLAGAAGRGPSGHRNRGRRAAARGDTR